MVKILAQLATFTIAFFAAQTIQFLGRWVVGLLSDKSTNYFSTMSAVVSCAFGVYWLFKINKDVKRNAKLSAARIIKEGCEISARISNTMSVNDIPGGGRSHLIQAATLEAIFGGSYLIPSGMNRDVLREGVRVYSEHFGNEFSRYFLDCHEAVQYVIKGSATPDGIIDASLIWLCGKLDELRDIELSEEQKNKVASVFRCELSEAIKKTPTWIRSPEKDLVN